MTTPKPTHDNAALPDTQRGGIMTLSRVDNIPLPPYISLTGSEWVVKQERGLHIYDRTYYMYVNSKMFKQMAARILMFERCGDTLALESHNGRALLFLQGSQFHYITDDSGAKIASYADGIKYIDKLINAYAYELDTLIKLHADTKEQ